MSEFTGSRFGQDLPARIVTSAAMLVEATDTLPGEPVYQPLIPFYPGGVVSGASLGSSSSLDGIKTLGSSPTQCDLTFYQGDDVIVPLYIADPDNPDSDMSDQTVWEWHAQIRLMHYFRTRLVNVFTTDAQYIAPVPPETIGMTYLQLFLPREKNIYWGDFEWELYSISPYDNSDFADPPDDWPVDAPWPPTTALRTWMYGNCKILARTSTTDVLPTPSTPYTGPPAVAAVNAGPFVVGPNGRVP